MENIVSTLRENLTFQTTHKKRTDFGPFVFKVLNIWLFLSIALRFKGATVGNPPLTLIYTGLSWLCLYFSFRVIASEFIQRSGGNIPQHNFSSGIAKWPECRTLLGCIAFLFFLALMTIVLHGSHHPFVKAFLFAFDGVAYDHHSIWHSILSALFAAFAFLCFLTHAFGFEARRADIFREMKRHFTYLGPALVVLILGYVFLSTVQGWVRTPLSAWMLENRPSYSGALYLAFMFVFSTLRLLLSVTIIGIGLNLSFTHKRHAKLEVSHPVQRP